MQFDPLPGYRRRGQPQAHLLVCFRGLLELGDELLELRDGVFVGSALRPRGLMATTTTKVPWRVKKMMKIVKALSLTLNLHPKPMHITRPEGHKGHLTHCFGEAGRRRRGPWKDPNSHGRPIP